MTVIHELTLDLVRPGIQPVITAVQGDSCTRVIALTLYAAGAPWQIPEGVSVVVRCGKSDGTSCVYDTLPDGSPAWEANGNVMSVTLAPQALTAAGMAAAQIVFGSGDKILSTFTLLINVQRDPSAGKVISEDYFNLQEFISEAVAKWLEEHPETIVVPDGSISEEKLTAELLEKIESGSGSGGATPVLPGVAGDGVTDDAAAIQAVLDANSNVQFDGSKTYLVGSTITVPADVHVDFRGATVVPGENHDVIRVKPGATVENLVVRCTDVAGWDSSALLFHGEDLFRGSNPTKVNNVKLYNNMVAGERKSGNGLYFYVDAAGQFIEGLSVEDVVTVGFGRGYHFHSTLQNEVETPVDAFILANTFRGCWSFKDTYGIYMDGLLPNTTICNNFFTDMHIQSDYYGGSVYAIYCNGGYSNYFSGCLYDYSIAPEHPETAVYFDTFANLNVIEVAGGHVTSDKFCVNKSGNNKVRHRTFSYDVNVPHRTGALGMCGVQDDVLTFSDKRTNCTLESLDVEPYSGSLANVFDPTPVKNLVYRSVDTVSNAARAIITINLSRAISELTHLVLQFTPGTPPRKVKVTLYNATDKLVICDTTTNANTQLVITPWMEGLATTANGKEKLRRVARIVVELSGFNFIVKTADGHEYGEWAIDRIMAVDSYDTGNTWLRRDGGEVYGNIKFAQNAAPILTDEKGKRYKLTVSAGVLGVVEVEDEDEEAPPVIALTPVMMAGASWYNTEASGVEQSSITGISFDASYEPTGNEDASWTCDEDGYGDIMAYRNGTEIVITPTTGSEHIQLNADSTYMFANDGTNANFSSLASIAGTEMWVADRNTDITRICAGNTLITTPVCVPEGVTMMNYAFQGCTALTQPPVLPEGLIGMASAFLGCTSMSYLPELPSTVTNINYTFQACIAATKAPSVVPAGIFTMNSAFRSCYKLNGEIEVNAANVSDYGLCFDGACRDSGSIVLTGSCPVLAELAATNTAGKVTVAS